MATTVLSIDRLQKGAESIQFREIFFFSEKKNIHIFFFMCLEEN